MKNNITKTSLEVLPSKVTLLGVFTFKKMIAEVLLALPLYLNIILHLLAISSFNKDNG